MPADVPAGAFFVSSKLVLSASLVFVNKRMCLFCAVGCSAQLALKATQIRVKAANSTVKESRDYLDRLPENLKDVERAFAPLKK